MIESRRRMHHAVYLQLLVTCSAFFFNDPTTTEIYTLSLHDALPISVSSSLTLERARPERGRRTPRPRPAVDTPRADRKSTRLNSSHVSISYAVFCLKKKTVDT